MIIFAFCLLLCPAFVQAKDEEEVINPHFTGKHCEECHVSAPQPGDKNLKLKFGGDDIAMCNSCHEKENVKGELHPVGIAPSVGEAVTIPKELPLYDGKVTCRTCHDVYLQCQAEPAAQFENINFLWGAPYKKVTEFCFRCHNRDVYAKTNPHEQVDDEGNVDEKQCLYCHESLPDPDAVTDITGVNFKTKQSTFCAACHGEEETLHPAKANHMHKPSEEMLAAIEASEEKYNVILPLFEEHVFCGTCHNPHDKGIIQREAAAKGAEAEYKLRLDRSKDMCVACHSDKEEVSARDIPLEEIQRTDLIPVTKGEGIPSYHKAFLEKKCRACHAVTREEPGVPNVFKMCFVSDCHDTPALLGARFTHKDAAEGNCLLCHSQHGSQFGAHIVNDQQKLCRACHPLLPPIEEDEAQQQKQDLHDYYYGLFQETVPEQELTCGYCHGEDHSGLVKEKGIIVCYQCHNYIEQLVKDERGGTENIHENLPRFAGNNCTVCHNPHSAPYEFLLREEPESYK